MLFIAALVLIVGLIALIAVAGFYVLMFSVGVTFIVLIALSIGIGEGFDLDPKSVMWLGLVPVTVLTLLVWGYITNRKEEEQLAREKAEWEAEQHHEQQAILGGISNRLGRWR